MNRRNLLSACVLLITSCGPTTDRPAPSCSPGSPYVVVIGAPADREYPECVEIPAQHLRGSTERDWCCWKDEVQP